jgi:hypothetical protein
MSRPVILKFIGDDAQLSRVFEKMGKASEKASKGFTGFSKIGVAAFAGLAGGAIATGAMLVRAGDKLNESQDLLKNALADTGQKVADLTRSTGPLMKQMEHWGIANSDVNDGLAKLVRAGDKFTTAQADMALAANVMKGRHIDLAAAEDLVVKVRTGHVALLGRYGINIKDVHGKVISQTEAIKRLSQVYKGAAEESTRSLAGKTAELKAKFEDVKAHVGQKLIPILLSCATFLTNTLVPAFSKVVDWVSNTWPKIEQTVGPVFTTIVGYVSGFISTVETLWNIFGGRIIDFATRAWGSVKLEISGALEVIKSVFRLFADLLTGKWSKLWGDILGIFGGVWKLIRGAIGLAWTEITAVVSLAWDGVKNVMAMALGWVGDRVSDVVNFFTGLPGRVVKGLGKMWDAVTGAFSGAFHWISDRVDDVVHFFTGLPDRIVRGLGNIADAIKGVFKTAFNGVANIWNSTVGSLSFHIPSWVPGIGGDGFDMPKIPLLAKGGIFTSKTLAYVGEAGPEMVLPLSPAKSGRAAQLMQAAGFAGAGHTDNSKTITNHIYVQTNADPHKIAREIAWSAKTSGW